MTLPTQSAAAQLAEFSASLSWAGLEATVRERTQELVLDLLGVAARGSAEDSSKAVARVAKEAGGGGEASLIGASACASAAWAALANGAAAHAIEMDDVTRESSLHPGAAVIPAALAVAEETGSPASSFLEAVVAGYEVTMRVGAALNPAAAYERGFHPTGVAGVFGAATAAGRILGLDADALTRALGIAGTMASGSLEYLSDGSWTKRLNPGWAAHAGIVAASLARAGFTGPATVFEGRLALLHGYTAEALPEQLLAGLGSALQIMRVGVKPYACCRYNHGLVDCVLALRQAHAIRPEDVETIRLGVLSAGWALVAEPIDVKRAPRTIVDAQFSAPFAAALALAHGAAGPDLYTAGALDDPMLRSLMQRTECYRDPTLDADFPRLWPAAVEVQLRDGRRVATRTEFTTGDPERPVPRAGLVAKFVSLAGNLMPAEQARELADRILHLESEPDLRAVAAALRG